jgi:hypothetical protein
MMLFASSLSLKVEINIDNTESYKTPELKSAHRDLKKEEARDLQFLTQLGSEDYRTSKVSSEEIVNHSLWVAPIDKTLVMEDVSTDGEDIFSTTMQVMQELLLDFAEPKAKEPKVGQSSLLPSSLRLPRNSTLLCLMGKPFSNLLRSTIMLNCHNQLVV